MAPNQRGLCATTRLTRFAARLIREVRGSDESLNDCASEVEKL